MSMRRRGLGIRGLAAAVGAGAVAIIAAGLPAPGGSATAGAAETAGDEAPVTSAARAGSAVSPADGGEVSQMAPRPAPGTTAASAAADDGPPLDDERGCAPGAGDCFTAHGGPGCEWGPCCELVCAVMPECCTNGWDELCAEMAADLCERPPACRTALHDCGDVDKDAGCGDRGCCELVCAIDPFCCSRSWDRLCVSAALETCGVGECVITVSTALDEAESCGEPINDGCDQPDGFAASSIALGESIDGRTFANGRRDVDWYAVDLGSQAAVARVQAAFPAEVSLVVGDCAGGFTAVDAIAVRACDDGTLTVPAGIGPAWIVIAPGRTGAPILRGIPCTDVDDPPVRTFGDRYVLSLRVPDRREG